MVRRMVFNPATNDYQEVDVGDVTDPTGTVAQPAPSTGTPQDNPYGAGAPAGGVPGDVTRESIMRNIGIDPNAYNQYFDKDWENAVTNAVSGYNNANAAYNEAMGGLDLAMRPYYTQLQQQNVMDQGRLNAALSNQGLLRSTNYSGALGQLQTGYQGQVGSLDEQRLQNALGYGRTKETTQADVYGKLRDALG